MNRQTPISLRRSAVAGRFFPADPDGLARAVTDCLDPAPQAVTAPRAVISPHAGYRFSGPLAGAAWRATEGACQGRIVVLSPSHRHAFDGVALPSQDRYCLPGFNLAIDDATREMLLARGLAHLEDAAHDHEHGIETQLPFLHRLHPGAAVVPLVIGRARRGQVADIVDALAATDTPPLFVLSSDLSHFLTLEAAERHDARTARLIETGAHDEITGAHACGAIAIRGFMSSRYGRGLRVQRLAMANSAAVTRDRRRTVGYGAWSFHDVADTILHPGDRATLLKTARHTLATRAKEGHAPEIEPGAYSPALGGFGAAFVTLRQGGELRGCIGSLGARRPLIADVADNTLRAGFADPRFAPVTAEDLGRITIKIAVLSPAAPMRFDDKRTLLEQLVAGRDGLVLTDRGRRGVFLPMVWDTLPEPEAFLAGLKRKAGLPEDHWSPTLRVSRFCAESFSERG